jgi:hypothetical protein
MTRLLQCIARQVWLVWAAGAEVQRTWGTSSKARGPGNDARNNWRITNHAFCPVGLGLFLGSRELTRCDYDSKARPAASEKYV